MQQNERQLPRLSTDTGGVLSHQYSYDNNGNVTQIQDLARGAHYSRTMAYDGLDRLTAAGSCSFGPGCSFQYAYDALDNLTRVQGPNSSDRYYCYDARWQLTNIKTGGCDGASVVGLDYDRGNLINKNGVDYDFDFGNGDVSTKHPSFSVKRHPADVRIDGQSGQSRLPAARPGGRRVQSHPSRRGFGIAEVC